MAKRTLVLLVLDGWGVGRKDNSNPIYLARPRYLNYIRLNYPAGTLQASGIAVGLPWNEPGSSEVGHLTLGAGKVLYQDYPRISLAIRDGSFFQNQELLRAIAHAKDKRSKVNLVGLLGKGSGHSVFEHLGALVELMRKKGVGFALHLFTDGKDSPPQSAVQLVSKLPQDKIGSLSGRYFAMDNDLHWDRTKRCFDALVGLSKPAGHADQGSSAATLLDSSYQRGLTDEFVAPVLVKSELAVGAGDSVIFFNFREDSMRQLAEMFVNPKAGAEIDPSTGTRQIEEHKIPDDLYLTTFTDYGDRFNLPAAFPRDTVVNPLGKVLADAGKVQLRVAESSKYAHVTYFFNGMNEKPFRNEYRVLIPSRGEAKIDQHPEMRTKEITARVLSALGEGIYDFILVNLANLDAMAHTGNVDAAIKAVAAVDEQVGLLAKAVIGSGSVMVMTSDHGNAEAMIDPRTGIMETHHNTSPVPVWVIASGYERRKTEAQADDIEKLNAGVLSDIAPTILELMGVPKPKEMTGISLLKLLR